VAMVPAIALAAVLFTRSVTTNFIFDEQEALLANPYVNGQNLRFVDAFRRDFWGLPPDRSVGSYRPLPNMVWRVIASSMHALHDGIARITHSHTTFALYPWVFHWVNVILHAANGRFSSASCSTSPGVAELRGLPDRFSLDAQS